MGWPLYWFVMALIGLHKVKVFAWLNYAITGKRP
jgi:hypothetical protein